MNYLKLLAIFCLLLTGREALAMCNENAMPQNKVKVVTAPETALEASLELAAAQAAQAGWNLMSVNRPNPGKDLYILSFTRCQAASSTATTEKVRQFETSIELTRTKQLDDKLQADRDKLEQRR